LIGQIAVAVGCLLAWTPEGNAAMPLTEDASVLGLEAQPEMAVA
jgi:hypothetical protein